MSINVVQVREHGTTPPGERPIEWTLLTNRPILTTQDLLDVVFGYSMRWRIEELHRTWKSGACRVEHTQLRSTSAVIKWATILVAVAARIERIKQLARKEPHRPQRPTNSLHWRSARSPYSSLASPRALVCPRVRSPACKTSPCGSLKSAVTPGNPAVALLEASRWPAD